MIIEFITAKLTSLVGGFFGGSAILTFAIPKNVREALFRGGISLISAMIFAVPMIHFFDLQNNWDNQMMCGFISGFVAHSILNMTAKLLVKHQNKDIVEAYTHIAKNKNVRRIKNDN